MRVRFGEAAEQSAEVARLKALVSQQADDLVAAVRYEYAKAGVVIGVISNLDLVFFGGAKRLVDWVSDIDTGSTLQYNWKYLADAIDLWAGAQRDRAEAEPTRWSNWADNGKEYIKLIAEYQKLAWESTGAYPVFVALGGTVKDLANALRAPFTPSMWPWWLSAGLAAGLGAYVYNSLRRS